MSRDNWIFKLPLTWRNLCVTLYIMRAASKTVIQQQMIDNTRS